MSLLCQNDKIKELMRGLRQKTIIIISGRVILSSHVVRTEGGVRAIDVYSLFNMCNFLGAQCAVFISCHVFKRAVTHL